MITLIRKGQVFSPESLGEKDILIVSDKIAAIIEPEEIKIEGMEVDYIDASNKFVIPGFIDSHVHILGGGGEGGPATRAPEITIEDIVSSGVTTVIGCLGTDCITRHIESLLAKAMGLEKEGINTYIFTGGWEIPGVTITQSVRSDLVFIDKVVGVGEIAISDHRSIQPTFDEFAKLAAECRIGGMIGGKAGILHCHVGSGPEKLEMIYRLIKETDIPPTQVIPTHINYSRDLLEDSVEFINRGGSVDLSAGMDPASDKGEISIASAISFYKDKNVSMENISVSSDSNGSLTIFDGQGALIGLTVATQECLMKNFRFLLQKEILDLEAAVKLFSTNPSTFYQLEQKGKIKEGANADIILLDQDYNLTDSLIKGRRMMVDQKLIAKGTFS